MPAAAEPIGPVGRFHAPRLVWLLATESVIDRNRRRGILPGIRPLGLFPQAIREARSSGNLSRLQGHVAWWRLDRSGLHCDLRPGLRDCACRDVAHLAREWRDHDQTLTAKGHRCSLPGHRNDLLALVGFELAYIWWSIVHLTADVHRHLVTLHHQLIVAQRTGVDPAKRALRWLDLQPARIVGSSAQHGHLTARRQTAGGIELVARSAARHGFGRSNACRVGIRLGSGVNGQHQDENYAADKRREAHGRHSPARLTGRKGSHGYVGVAKAWK